MNARKGKAGLVVEATEPNLATVQGCVAWWLTSYDRRPGQRGYLLDEDEGRTVQWYATVLSLDAVAQQEIGGGRHVSSVALCKRKMRHKAQGESRPIQSIRKCNGEVLWSIDIIKLGDSSGRFLLRIFTDARSLG